MPRGERIGITLTEDEKKTLLMWVRSTKKKYAQRARVILLSADHTSLPEISKVSGLSMQNCSKWRMRFLEGGIEALKDLPRKGRPPLISQETRQKIIELGHQERRQEKNRWTIQSLAMDTGVGRTSIHRILSQKNSTRHRVQHWTGKSTDPEFVEKQVGILGLCLNPVANGLVLGVDEKTPTQIPGQTQPEPSFNYENHMKDNNQGKAHGTNSLLAALSHHKRVIGRRHEVKSDSMLLLNFLKRLYRDFPRQHMHIITESVSLSQRKDVMDWIEKRRRLSIYFTPTRASWIAQIEIWLNIFTRDTIPLGPWKSKKQVVDQILQHIRFYSSKKVYPFSWTCHHRPIEGIPV
jgi:transposase